MSCFVGAEKRSGSDFQPVQGENRGLSGRSGWIDSSVLERERTSREPIGTWNSTPSDRTNASNTISQRERFGVERSRNAVHDWAQKADLQPASDANPDHVALDETVIRINCQQFWLYAAVVPETNRFLH